MTAIEVLDAALKQIDPAITGVSIGKWDDKATWRVDGAPLTSALLAAIAAFDKSAVVPAPTHEQQLAAIEARVTALEKLKEI